MDDEGARGDENRKHEAPRAPGTWSPRQEVAVYLVIALAYMLLGLAVKGVFAWWPYSTAFLLLAIWGIPAAWRRLA